MPIERICYRCQETTVYPVLYHGKFYHDFCVERELREHNNGDLNRLANIPPIEEKKPRHQERENRR
jgi:hypothetical protein